MIHTDVLIVGAGPAGTSCAWKLQQAGVDFLLLDKTVFPCFKPCAGWITPQVLRDLAISPDEYPAGITHFDRFQVWIKDFHFQLRTDQYAIRRVEFDAWLLQRVKPRFANHQVRSIVLDQDRYVIDGMYSARVIVGAGGTHCPVASEFFKDQHKGTLIVAQEEEFLYDFSDPRCHLWFLQNRLPGYAWYVPKANGVVNVGVGGSAADMKAKGDSLKRHWNLLIEKLEKEGLVRGHEYKPAGHFYHLRGKNLKLRNGNTFIVGDALGLATLDMGEGIGPAIQSGIRAADSILRGSEYHLRGIPRYSLPSLIGLIR